MNCNEFLKQRITPEPIFQLFCGSWTETEPRNTATLRHSCWAARPSILLPRIPCAKVILGARGPLDYWRKSSSKVFGESRITYHINHTIPAMLIHSVYSSSKISERDNEKLFGLSLKHTSLFASWENNLLLWRKRTARLGGSMYASHKKEDMYTLFMTCLKCFF